MQDVQDAGVSTRHGYTTPGNRFSENTKYNFETGAELLYCMMPIPPIPLFLLWTPRGPGRQPSGTCACNNLDLFVAQRWRFLQYTSRMASRPVSNNVFCGFLRTYYLVLYNHDS
jgi:hypothetical protein